MAITSKLMGYGKEYSKDLDAAAAKGRAIAQDLFASIFPEIELVESSATAKVDFTFNNGEQAIEVECRLGCWKDGTKPYPWDTVSVIERHVRNVYRWDGFFVGCCDDNSHAYVIPIHSLRPFPLVKFFNKYRTDGGERRKLIPLNRFYWYRKVSAGRWEAIRFPAKI